MPLLISLANAVDREVAWLTEDLVGYPPLLRDSTAGDDSGDGPFDYIGPRLQRVAQKPRQIHVYRDGFTEERIDTATKRVTHHFVAIVLWPISNVDRPDTAEQLALDEALELLLTRVRGDLLDKTHGGRFWSVGETGELAAGQGVQVLMPDWRTATEPIDAPLGAGAAYAVEVHYPAIDHLSA